MLFGFAFTQTKRIDKNIQKIDNSQFIINHDSKASFSFNSSAAHKLIRIGKPATARLIGALNDPNKIIMAHLTLCHIYYKHASFAGPKEFIQNNETVFKYFLGQEKGEGLIISEMKKDGKYTLYIEEKDKADIIVFWNAKLKQ